MKTMVELGKEVFGNIVKVQETIDNGKFVGDDAHNTYKKALEEMFVASDSIMEFINAGYNFAEPVDDFNNKNKKYVLKLEKVDDEMIERVNMTFGLFKDLVNQTCKVPDNYFGDFEEKFKVWGEFLSKHRNEYIMPTLYNAN